MRTLTLACITVAVTALGASACQATKTAGGGGGRGAGAKVRTELRFTLPDRAALAKDVTTIESDMNAYSLVVTPVRGNCGKAVETAGPYDDEMAKAVVDASCDYDVELSLGKSEETELALAGTTTYEDLAPIVASQCLSCHKGASAQGGVDLSKDGGVTQAKKGIVATVLGESGAAKIMPPSGKLPSKDVALFKAWRDAGYPLKANDAPPATKGGGKGQAAVSSLAATYYASSAPTTVKSRDLQKYKIFSTGLTLDLTAEGKSLGLKKATLTTLEAVLEPNDAGDGTGTATGTDGGDGGRKTTDKGTGKKVTYADDIGAIIDGKCAFCHNGSRASDLSSFAKVKAKASAIIDEVVTRKTMPQAAPLPQAERDLFEAWKRDGYLEKASDAGTKTSGNASSGDPNVVEFRIADGTGRGAWNDAASKVSVKVGQTLRIHNDDKVTHQLHTNGAPCGHGTPIAPGKSFDCVARQPYSGSPLYDHNFQGNSYFYLEATR